jgi:succinate dehydrogenase / fumarate reductase cytochrome b subunit
MLGPYYRLQLTSVLSLTHRLTGVFLSLVGAPVLLWWILAVSGGQESYQAMSDCLSGWLGLLLGFALAFSLSFHFFNGIRHLVWDTGKMLEIKQAYASGWVVVIASLFSTGLITGALL